MKPTQQHTPGPWTYQRLQPYMKGCSIGTGDLAIPTAGTLIATAWNTTKGLSGPQDAETEANARLVAAAPELLEAAKVAHRWLSSGLRKHEAIRELLRAAIAKATGEET